MKVLWIVVGAALNIRTSSHFIECFLSSTVVGLLVRGLLRTSAMVSMKSVDAWKSTPYISDDGLRRRGAVGLQSDGSNIVLVNLHLIFHINIGPSGYSWKIQADNCGRHWCENTIDGKSDSAQSMVFLRARTSTAFCSRLNISPSVTMEFLFVSS